MANTPKKETNDEISSAVSKALDDFVNAFQTADTVTNLDGRFEKLAAQFTELGSQFNGLTEQFGPQ